MAGFNSVPVLSTETDGLFNAITETSAAIRLSPSTGPASIVITETVTSFTANIYASNGGTRFASISGLNAIAAAGAYELGGPWTHIKVVLDACTAGGGSVFFDLCWKYD